MGTMAPWGWMTWLCGPGPAGHPGTAPLRILPVASLLEDRACGGAKPAPQALSTGVPGQTTPQRQPKVCAGKGRGEGQPQPEQAG